MKSDKGIKIASNKQGRRWVIGDIHGCAKTLIALIENGIKLTKSDQLFFIGDYIDRGSDSSGVLDYIIKLIDDDFHVFALRGNHEENILKAFAEYDSPTFVHYVQRINKSKNLIDNSFGIKAKYLDFFNSLPYYYELDDFYLVHAGIDFSKEKPFEDTASLLNLRFESDKFDISKLQGKRMVYGHQPTEIQIIRNAVEQKAQIIPIDNGCVYTKKHKVYDYTKLGNLCALNLDSFELIAQTNIDI